MQAVLITCVLQKCSLIQMLKVDIKFAFSLYYGDVNDPLILYSPSTIGPSMQLGCSVKAMSFLIRLTCLEVIILTTSCYMLDSATSLD